VRKAKREAIALHFLSGPAATEDGRQACIRPKSSPGATTDSRGSMDGQRPFRKGTKGLAMQLAR